MAILPNAPMTSYDLAGPDPNPMTRAEVDALKSLVPTSPGFPIIIQIGAERGCSTVAILEANPHAFIFSIDIGERPEERRNVQLAGLPVGHVVRGLGRSQEIGEHWPIEWEADLIYIDGDHRETPVLQDITFWRYYVKPNGVLALHDYIPPETRAPHIQGRVYEAVAAAMDLGILAGFTQILHVERLLAFARRRIPNDPV